MVARNEIYWARLPSPAGRRPVCVLTRDLMASILRGVTIAPITRTRRGIASEVSVGEPEGLEHDSVINCDSVMTIRKADLDPEPVGFLSREKRAALDRALRYALDIVY